MDTKQAREFVARSRAEIQSVLENKRRDATFVWEGWEGTQACKELSKTGLENSVLLREPRSGKSYPLPKDWRLREPLKEMSRDIELYRSTNKKVVQYNEQLKQANDFLATMSRRFEKEATSSSAPEIKKLLRKIQRSGISFRTKEIEGGTIESLGQSSRCLGAHSNRPRLQTKASAARNGLRQINSDQTSSSSAWFFA